MALGSRTWGGASWMGGRTATASASSFFADHAGDGQVQKYRLYFLGLATPVYWTDCDVDIEWGGQTWVASPIIAGAVTDQPAGAVASFEYGDADGTVFTALGTQAGGELATAAIYEAGFLIENVSPVPDEVRQIFSGLIDRVAVSTSQRDVLTFALMPAALSTAAMLPLRLLSTLLRT